MKSHLPVFFKGDSIKELQTAIQFIKKDKPLAAENFKNKLILSIEKLPEFPYSHPECKELPTKAHKYRNAIVSPYRIIYKINSESIDILSVFHSSRNPKALKKLRGS